MGPDLQAEKHLRNEFLSYSGKHRGKVASLRHWDRDREVFFHDRGPVFSCWIQVFEDLGFTYSPIIRVGVRSSAAGQWFTKSMSARNSKRAGVRVAAGRA
jgi:hypothetical protein